MEVTGSGKGGTGNPPGLGALSSGNGPECPPHQPADGGRSRLSNFPV